MDTSCFDNIVGVAQNGCSCVTASPESLSGLYLDDTTIGHIPLSASIFDCNDGDVTAFLQTLISNTTIQVLNELRKQSDKVMNKRYLDINTVIGWKDTWTTHIEDDHLWYYLALKPKFTKGLYFKIDSIEWLIQETERTIQYKIVDEYGNDASSGSNLSDFESVTLKMDRKWFILVGDDPTAHPKNTTAKECCGYYPTFTPYVTLGSGYSEDWTSLINQPASTFTKSIETYGIIVNGQFICNGFDFICSLDFKNSNWGALFANTVQQQARLNLAAWLVGNNKVTNYILLNKEQLAQTMEYLTQKVNENLAYLPTIYNFSDCYACPGAYKGGIYI
jgi:hypothetical protein